MNQCMAKYDKIIFLDFDGVLVPYDSEDERDYFGTIFNNQCVESLHNIIIQTKAKIVVISSWTNYLSLIKLKLMWKYRKMPGMIVGRIKNDSVDRSAKIDTWLRKNPTNNYIIIDDMGACQFGLLHRFHIVQPKTRVGLSKKESILAIEKLNIILRK